MRASRRCVRARARDVMRCATRRRCARIVNVMLMVLMGSRCHTSGMRIQSHAGVTLLPVYMPRVRTLRPDHLQSSDLREPSTTFKSPFLFFFLFFFCLLNRSLRATKRSNLLGVLLLVRIGGIFCNIGFWKVMLYANWGGFIIHRGENYFCNMCMLSLVKSIGLSDFSIDREDNRETWSGSVSRYSACYERWTDGGRRGAESTCCNETRRAFAIAFLDVTSAPLPPPPTHTFL